MIFHFSMKLLLQQMIEAQNQPAKLSELHFLIAHQFAETAGQLEEMIPESTELMRDLMIENKTVAKARQMFELSNIGIKEKKLKIQLKSLEKLMSACKRRLESLAQEAQNLY